MWVSVLPSLTLTCGYPRVIGSYTAFKPSLLENEIFHIKFNTTHPTKSGQATSDCSMARIVITTIILMLNLVTITMRSLNSNFKHQRGSVRGSGGIVTGFSQPPTVPRTDSHESERNTSAYQFPKSSEFSEPIFYHNGISYFHDL